MPTENPYRLLTDALIARRDVIADRAHYERDPQSHLAALQRASEEITKLQQTLTPPVPAQLAHFLDRCSYDKALAYIKEMNLDCSKA
ncbi:MAG: hypothetical protein ACO1QR_08640 [Chthoniobacteraceae bacterium]